MITCRTCGSKDILQAYWVNPNTKELGHPSMDTDMGWCNNCDNYRDVDNDEDL